MNGPDGSRRFNNGGTTRGVRSDGDIEDDSRALTEGFIILGAFGALLIIVFPLLCWIKLVRRRRRRRLLDIEYMQARQNDNANNETLKPYKFDSSNIDEKMILRDSHFIKTINSDYDGQVDATVDMTETNMDMSDEDDDIENKANGEQQQQQQQQLADHDNDNDGADDNNTNNNNDDNNPPLMEDTSSFRKDESCDSLQMIRLPNPGIGFTTEECQLRTTSTLCAICLVNYRPGDEIIWSSNPQCPHVYHIQCFREWNEKRKGESLCPCCRREFIQVPKDKEQPK